MFDFWIASPVKAKRPGGLRRLQDLIKATCLRRTKILVKDSVELPQRFEQTETVRLHPEDRMLYDFFKEKTATLATDLSLRKSSTVESNRSKDDNILSLINFLRLICNHGKELLPLSALKAWETRDSVSIDWEMMCESTERCRVCGQDLELLDSPAPDEPYVDRDHSICSSYTCQSKHTLIKGEAKYPIGNPAFDILSNSGIRIPTATKIRSSAKIEALLRNLRAEQHGADSQRNTGNMIKRYFGYVDLHYVSLRC